MRLLPRWTEREDSNAIESLTLDVLEIGIEAARIPVAVIRPAHRVEVGEEKEKHRSAVHGELRARNREDGRPGRGQGAAKDRVRR